MKKTAWKSLSAHARTQKIQPSGHLNVLYHRTTWHLVPKVCCWGTATSSHVPRKWSCAQCSCSAVYLRVGEHNVSCSRSESIVGTDEMGHSSNRQWRTRRRGRRPPPWLEIFRANFVFRASSSCSKILKNKKYINTVENFRATSVLKLFFQSKRKFLKNRYFNAMKYFTVNSVFQGKRKLFKILKDKQYIQYSEFRAYSDF